MNKEILINNIWTKEQNELKRNIVLVSMAFIFLSIMSQLKIFLPFTPVPITGQTLAIILIGLSLNRVQSTSTVLLYMFAGEMGLPIFAGFKSGILLSPSGGYVIGFFFAVQMAAYLSEKGWTKSLAKLMISFIIVNTTIYVFGLAQLSLFVPTTKLLAVGLYPFILGDIIKMIIASLLIKRIWKVLEK